MIGKGLIELGEGLIELGIGLRFHVSCHFIHYHIHLRLGQWAWGSSDKARDRSKN